MHTWPAELGEVGSASDISFGDNADGSTTIDDDGGTAAQMQ